MSGVAAEIRKRHLLHTSAEPYRYLCVFGLSIVLFPFLCVMNFVLLIRRFSRKEIFVLFKY
jgi:hypothetical protein